MLIIIRSNIQQANYYNAYFTGREQNNALTAYSSTISIKNHHQTGAMADTCVQIYSPGISISLVILTDAKL